MKPPLFLSIVCLHCSLCSVQPIEHESSRLTQLSRYRLFILHRLHRTQSYYDFSRLTPAQLHQPVIHLLHARTFRTPTDPTLPDDSREYSTEEREANSQNLGRQPLQRCREYEHVSALLRR